MYRLQFTTLSLSCDVFLALHRKNWPRSYSSTTDSPLLLVYPVYHIYLLLVRHYFSAVLSLSPELYDNSSSIVSSSTTAIKKKHHDGKLRTSKAQASPKDHLRVGRDDTTQRYQESHNSHVTLKSISTIRCIQR